jgi:GAF domain-containing protein
MPADRLRDIESVTDAALSTLNEQSLLNTLLDRVKEVLAADTAAVLLLDRPAGQLVATAASGIEEEVPQGLRVPLGTGFAGRSQSPADGQLYGYSCTTAALPQDRRVRQSTNVTATSRMNSTCPCRASGPTDSG